MPTPLGHALGGVAAGWLIAGRPAWHTGATAGHDAKREADAVRRPPWRRLWDQPAVRSAIWFGLLGALPDIDFLFGVHSAYTHSVGAVLVVGVAVLAWAGTRRWPLAVASAAAYATHVLFDWWGNDNSPPIGIMALWPFSSAYYQSDAYVFEAVSRRYWLPGFVAHNARAVAWELAILVPLVVMVAWLRGRDPARVVLGSPVSGRAEPS